MAVCALGGVACVGLIAGHTMTYATIHQTPPKEVALEKTKGCCLICNCGLQLQACCDGCKHLKPIPDPSKKESRIAQTARSLCKNCCDYKRKSEEKKP